MEKIDDMKSLVRDLNLNLLMKENKITLDPKKRYDSKINWFMPNRKLIKSIIKFGGVLTGSRAIACYKLNNKQLLDRKTKDWDFIVTLDIAFKIFEKFNIDSIPVSGKVISIKDQWRYVHPAYSDSYRVRPVDVQILIKDNLPEYINSDGVRFASLGYCLNEKINMIDDLRVEIDLKKSNSLKMSSISNEIKELGKHQSDMTRILVRFNS